MPQKPTCNCIRLTSGNERIEFSLLDTHLPEHRTSSCGWYINARGLRKMVHWLLLLLLLLQLRQLWLLRLLLLGHGSGIRHGYTRSLHNRLEARLLPNIDLVDRLTELRLRHGLKVGR